MRLRRHRREPARCRRGDRPQLDTVDRHAGADLGLRDEEGDHAHARCDRRADQSGRTRRHRRPCRLGDLHEQFADVAIVVLADDSAYDLAGIGRHACRPQLAPVPISSMALAVSGGRLSRASSRSAQVGGVADLLRLLGSAGPRDDGGGRSSPALGNGGAHLVRVGRRPATRPRHLDPLGTDDLELGVAEVADHVGHDVVLRIGGLVQDLLRRYYRSIRRRPCQQPWSGSPSRRRCIRRWGSSCSTNRRRANRCRSHPSAAVHTPANGR